MQHALSKRLSARLRLTFVFGFFLEHFLGWTPLQRPITRWRKRTLRGIHATLEAQPGQGVVPVPAPQDLVPEVFEQEYFKRGRCVVLRGAAKEWPAVKRWSLEFLAKEYGDDPVILSNHRAFSEEGSDAEQEESEVTDLRDVIENLARDRPKYARFHPLLDRHPELQEDLDQGWLERMKRKNPFARYNFHTIFIGARGNRTPTHNAGNDNLFIQIAGRKTWHLWEADCSYAFDPEVNRGPAKHSSVGPEETAAWYPKLRTYRVKLEPGDVLYVPAYAWHYVHNEEDAIGLGVRWTSPWNSLRRSPWLFFLEFFNTSPSIFSVLFERDFNKFLVANRRREKRPSTSR